MKFYFTLFFLFQLGITIAQDSSFPTTMETEPVEEKVKKKKPNNKSWFFGMTTAIQAVTTTEQIKTDQPFEVGTPPLFTGVTMATGRWAFTPFYNFGSNSTGLFVTFSVSDHLGAYFVADKQLSVNNGFYGFGLATPIYDDIAQAFIEVGRDYQKTLDPVITIGMYVSFNTLLSGPEMDMSFIL